MSTENQMVTVATFSESTLAFILKGRLESEGIPCLVADGNIVPYFSFFSDKQGVRVQVLEKDRIRAEEIIRSLEVEK